MIKKLFVCATLVIACCNVMAQKYVKSTYSEDLVKKITEGSDPTKDDLKSAIDGKVKIAASDIGDDVFMYPTESAEAYNQAIDDAQGVWEDEAATSEQISTQINALNDLILPALNAPDPDRTYRIYLKENDTWTYAGNAITSCAGDRDDMGGYNLKYKPSTNNFQQAMYFESVEVEGRQNTYKINFEDAEKSYRYICTGACYEGGDAYQLRTTLNDEEALVIEVRRNGGYNQFYNTEANLLIGSQDEDVFTIGSHNDLEIYTCNFYSSADVSLARKYATVVLPFNSDEKPEEIDKIYNVTGLEEDGKTLVLEEVESFDVSKAYLVEIKEIDEAGSATFYGIPVAYKQPEANGLLKGTFLNIQAPAGSYVLQTQNDVQKFYKVAADKRPWVYANNAYLELPTGTGAKSLSIGASEVTAIKAIDALVNGDSKIYDINGRELKSLQKGVNIVNGVKVLVK